MERITDPVRIRDYNENGDIAFEGYMQPGWIGEWPCRFVFADGETGVVRFAARENSISFGNNTVVGDKYIYAEIGAENEPYLRYNVTINKWELYPAPSGGTGPILAEHTILDQDIHTDTVSGSVVLGDIIAGNATPRWQRVAGNTTTQRMFLRQVGNGAVSALPTWDTINASTDITAGILPIARGGTGLGTLGSANQLLGVNGAANALEYKNISSLVSAGSGIGVSGTATITISNTGVLSLNTLSGALTLAGTTNQVNVSSGGATITLSTPQNIHTGASPTFAGLTLTGLSGVLIGNGASAVGAVAATAGSQYFRRNAGHTAYEFGTIIDSDIPATIVRTSRQILTSNGLSGGGDLSTDRTISWNGLTVRKNSGANVGTKRRINFIEGGGISITLSDDVAEDEIDALISSDTIGVTSLNGLMGALTLQGTQNQINVYSDGSTITLTAPQDIHTGATPNFAGLVASFIRPLSDSTTAVQIRNAAGTSILNIDTTNNRVGLNTTSPNTTLHIFRSGATPNMRLETDISTTFATSYLVLAGRNSNNESKDYAAIIFQQRGTTAGAERGAFFMGLMAGGTWLGEALFLEAPTVIDSRLGLRGLNASSQLKETARIQGYMKDNTASAEKSYMAFFTIILGTVAERMRIDEDKLGIGLVPSERLHVSGNIRCSGQLIAGSTPVTLTDSAGKIQGLSSTYFASLDASALTATLTMRKNSVAVGSARRQLNFIESSGMQLDVVDDGTEFDVTPRVKRMIVLPIPGDPAAGATVSVRIAAQTGGTITAIRHICTTAASTTYTYDVNKNGTTIYSEQGNRPTRTSGNGTSLVTATAPNVTGFNANDVFEIDLDSKGTNVKDVVFFIYYTET